MPALPVPKHDPPVLILDEDHHEQTFYYHFKDIYDLWNGAEEDAARALEYEPGKAWAFCD